MLLILGVSAMFMFAFARNYIQDYNIKKEISALKNEVQALETKKLESLEILDYVMSDTFVEEKGRTELHLKKPGEKVLVIQNTQKQQDIEIKDPLERQHLSKPARWWYYFTTHELPPS